MGNAELHFVDTLGPLARRLDSSLLIAGSQKADLLPLTKKELASHKLGVFVAWGLGKDSPAVGYVACRTFLEIPGQGAEPALTAAVIDSLYLEHELRGKQIAEQLVERVTNLTFQSYEHIEACVAACNPLSLGAFREAGYAGAPQDIGSRVVATPGETPLMVLRSEW